MQFSQLFVKMYVVEKKRGDNMPNIKSAKKRVLTSAKRKEMNTVKNSSMKTAIKNVEKEAKHGSKDTAAEKLNVAIKRKFNHFLYLFLC